jgi:DNA-binding transcriptional ArsR family regulator
METPKIEFRVNEIYDFLGSLVRLVFKETYDGLVGNHLALKAEGFITDWTDTVINGMDKAETEDYNFFFDPESAFGMGLLKLAEYKNVETVGGLIKAIEDMDGRDLVPYFMEDQSIEGSRKMMSGMGDRYFDAYRYIDENFKFSSENKWRLLSLINEPDSYKVRLIGFLQHFYEEYYKSVRDKSLEAVKRGSGEIIGYINESPSERLKEAAMIDAFKDGLSRVVIGFSYFSEYGISIIDDIDTNTSIVLMGTKRLEIMRILSVEAITEEKFIEICRVMGDRTRIEILKMLSEGPVYGAWAAEKFNISSPAVSYHFDQFVASGLVKARKEGHRLYYHLIPERIEQVQSFLAGLIRKGSEK